MNSTARAYGGMTRQGWDEPRVYRRQEIAFCFLDGREHEKPYPVVMLDEENHVFAFRADAESFIEERRAGGWAVEHGPTPLCTWSYAGPTDSSANAWSVRVVRLVDEEVAAA